MRSMHDIDPNGFYTIEHAAKLLMRDEPELSFAEAYQIICDAIDNGKLKIAGYLTPKDYP